jgi:hypothetical protein
MEIITIRLLTVGEEKLLRDVYSFIKKIKRAKINAFLTSCILILLMGIGIHFGITGPFDAYWPQLWLLTFWSGVAAAGLAFPIFYLFFKPRIRLNVLRLKDLLDKQDTLQAFHKLGEIRLLLQKLPLSSLKQLSNPLLIQEDALQFLARALTGYYG